MSRRLTIKIASLVGSVALLGGAALVASGATGAYFSDSKAGNVTGTVGNVHVAPSGGSGANGTDLAFSNLLPGEKQTVSLNFQNSGSTAEDIYIVFPNATALSALNNLGTFGEAHLSAGGVALFDSANLKDSASSCGAFSPSGCWPLKSQYLLASNVNPGDVGSFSFSFNYASKLQGQAPQYSAAAPWNSWPITGQTTTVGADGSGNGLPYKIVATQHGVTPGQ